MHGTAAGLVGAAVGRLRFQRKSSRGVAVVGGALAAIVLHAAFNAVSQLDLVGDALITPVAVGIGLLGVGLIATFINRGLQEEGEWMVETLDRKVNVTAAEARAARSFATIDELLRPIAEQFPDKAEQVESLLLRQAQLGIKRKVLQKVEAPATRAKLEADVATLQGEMEDLRRQIGPYVMIYVRSVFPEGAFNIWNNLELAAARNGPADLQRWAERLQPKPDAPPARNIFQHLGGDGASSE
jgi:hypothetical protein